MYLWNKHPLTSPLPYTLAPRDTPTRLLVVQSTSTEFILSWEMPSSCERYGGNIVGYRLEYSYRQADTTLVTSQEDIMLTNTFTLTNLVPDTLYEVRVALLNTEGVGPFSPVAMGMTLPHIGNFQLLMLFVGHCNCCLCCSDAPTHTHCSRPQLING